MQKVESSSLFSRFDEAPADAGVFSYKDPRNGRSRRPWVETITGRIARTGRDGVPTTMTTRYPQSIKRRFHSPTISTAAQIAKAIGTPLSDIVAHSDGWPSRRLRRPHTLGGRRSGDFWRRRSADRASPDGRDAEGHTDQHFAEPCRRRHSPGRRPGRHSRGRTAFANR
jgi:hypothetical protein